ncbi:MAG: flippase [Lachnospiraceae bacterium]|nr:flippase [Lachnospiraceae bacterium]
MPVRSLKYNFIMNAISTAASVIFPLIVFVYVSHVLAPEGRGKVAFAASFVSYFTMTAMLGIPTYGIRVTAQLRDDRERLSRTVQELLIINTVMSVISYLVFLVPALLVPRLKEEPALLFIHSALILFAFTGIDWLYRGLEQYRFITIVSLAFRVTNLLFVVLFVRNASDYVIYGAITVIGPLCVNLIYCAGARRFITLRPLGSYNLLPHLKRVLVFFATTCAISVYTHLDTTMLGFMKTDADVGYYTVAVHVKTLLVSVVTSLGAVLLPRSSRYVDQNRMEEFRALSAKGLRFVILLATPLVLYFQLYAYDGILFLSGEAYLPSVTPMRIIMPALLLIGLTNILGIQMLVPLGREKTVFYSVLAGATVDFVLNLVLIPRYAASGAAFGTLVAEAAVLIVQAVALKDVFFSAMREVPFFRIALALAAACGCSVPVRFPETGSFFRLAVTAALFFAAYAAVLLLLTGKVRARYTDTHP